MKKVFIVILCALQIFCVKIGAFAAGGGTILSDSNAKIMFNAGASDHFVMLSDGGLVSAWGKNDCGQCGVEESEYEEDINYINFENKVKKVAAGKNFSLALDENADVWGWGSNLQNRLGVVSEDENIFNPVKIAESVKDIAAGEDFCVFLKEDGNLYISGGENVLDKVDFEQMGEKAKSVSARKENIVVLTEKNNIFSLTGSERTPKKIEFSAENEIAGVFAGAKHAVILTRDEEKAYVYTFGDNTKNQLGSRDVEEFSETPVCVLEILCDEKNVNIAVGDYVTFVDVYEKISSMSEIEEYCFGTGCFYTSEKFDDYTGYQSGFEENEIKIPEKREVNHIVLACGNERNIAFRTDDAIEVFGNGKTPEVTHILQPAHSKNLYAYEFENMDFETVTVNFIKIYEDEFEQYERDYDYWKYTDEHTFKVKVKNFISGMGNNAFAIKDGIVRLPVNITKESRIVANTVTRVWNFERFNESFLADNIQIEHGNEDGKSVCVSAIVYKNGNEEMLDIPSETQVFYKSPEKICETTQTGLYVYGLPSGVSADVLSIENGKINLKLTGNSDCDLDYDTGLKICYVYYVKDKKVSGSVGDFDLSQISAKECDVRNFKITSTENTPEILTASAQLVSGKEDGKEIKLNISGGEFSQDLDKKNWKIESDGNLEIEQITRTDKNNAVIVVKGNSADKYKEHEIKVICEASEYNDSRYYNESEDTFTYVCLTSNILKTAKQEKQTSGFNTGSKNVSKEKYTIKFNTDGGSLIKDVKAEKGSVINNIEEPTKEGYVFDGWYKDEKLAEPYDLNEKVSSSKTLYAAWKTDPKRQFVLTVNENDAVVFGKTITNDVAPIIKDNRVMLPARFVAESLGAQVIWNGEEKSVTINGKNLNTQEDVKIVIYIDNKIVYVNEKEEVLDAETFVQNDRTYTPIRFICEKLGADVSWDEDTNQATVTKPI